jgi:hypothetical protein
MTPVVTEYQLHQLVCPVCGDKTRAAWPDGVTTRAYGPRVHAITALCTGAYRLSKRTTQQLLNDLFDVPMSLGTISTLEAAADWRGYAKEKTMNDDLQDFENFMKQRQVASHAYVQGNAHPLRQIVARVSPATFFGPTGGSTQGTGEVASRYEKDAEAFAPGSRFDFEILQMAASDGIAYWVGFMRGEARRRGQPEAIPMTLRVTEVFRREGGN